VGSPSGAIGAGAAAKNVDGVTVTCHRTWSVGGTVTGLLPGTAVALSDGGAPVPVGADGAFSFPTRQVTGAPYNVTVSTQPPGEVCTVTGGQGAIGNSNVEVAVTCKEAFSISGTLTGLPAGSSVTLADANAGSVVVNATGPFHLPNALLAGSQYNVTGTVSGKACVVTHGAGVVNHGPVADVSVRCP
jgi:hypothetical protein